MLVHTRHTLSSTVINSHQKTFLSQACLPPGPHWSFLFPLMKGVLRYQIGSFSLINVGEWFSLPALFFLFPKNHPAEEWVLCIAVALMLLPFLSIQACALFAHASMLVLLLIFGWLPNHCPFLELGPCTQTFSFSLCYTLIWLVEQKTLHGTGSLKDPLKWYLL